jgi:hypothetical protein
VATVHDATKEMIMANLTLLHVFHANTLADNLWVAHALSQCTPIRYGRIASMSVIHDATQFVGHDIFHMRQYIIKCLFNRAQLMWALIIIGRGYHLGALNL